MLSTDALAIYLLNLLLAFLQPKFDPSLEADIMADSIEEGGEQEEALPTSARDDEFRPFVRRLPEWNFWSVVYLVYLQFPFETKGSSNFCLLGSQQLAQLSYQFSPPPPSCSISQYTGPFSWSTSSRFLPSP